MCCMRSTSCLLCLITFTQSLIKLFLSKSFVFIDQSLTLTLKNYINTDWTLSYIKVVEVNVMLAHDQ